MSDDYSRVTDVYERAERERFQYWQVLKSDYDMLDAAKISFLEKEVCTKRGWKSCSYLRAEPGEKGMMRLQFRKNDEPQKVEKLG